MTESFDVIAAELMDNLLRRGFSVFAEGDRLFILPRANLTAEDVAAIRTAKPAMLEMLQRQPARDWQLTLKPLPGPVPPVVRMRRILKSLLRTYGFRCTKVEEITP